MARHGVFRIGFLVHDVSRLRRTVLDDILKPLGITRAQWWTLANLSREDADGMIQSDLADFMDVGKATIGGLIMRLEAVGFIERRPDPSDLRIKRVRSTPKGRRVLEQIRELAERFQRDMISGIDEADIEVAADVLHEMKRRLLTMRANGRAAGQSVSRKRKRRRDSKRGNG